MHCTSLLLLFLCFHFFFKYIICEYEIYYIYSPNGSPCANNHCITRYEQIFRHSKHTYTNFKNCYRQTFQAQSLSSSLTTSWDAKPTQHIESTHPDNVNLKLVFHNAASFHPHYLTFTPQTYHYPAHRFRSWHTQITSPSHPYTQARVQPRNINNHTYIQFLPGQNKNNLILNPVKTTCTMIHARPCVL